MSEVWRVSRTPVLLLAAAASACGGDDNASSGGVDAGGTSISCGTAEKLCGVSCVAKSDPSFGCASTTCEPCALPNATAVCDAEACALGVCTAPFADCDGIGSNGCEANLNEDDANCGACGQVCAAPPGGPCPNYGQCIAGVCPTVEEESGFGDCDCDFTNGSETELLSDPANCGGCGIACSFAHAAALCASGSCDIGPCDAGFADCDGLAANGCEVNVAEDLSNCGACGVLCSDGCGPGGCVNGTCTLVTCSAPMCNCDGDVSNGCETNLDTDPSHCGVCDLPCGSAHAMADCALGTCQILQCDAGWADCDGSAANGCETMLGTGSNCASCGNACGLANGGFACFAGTCMFSGAIGGPWLRESVDQTGDFVLIGNAVGYECAAGTPLPVVGTLGACGASTDDSAPDVLWRADSPLDGQAEANTGIGVEDARSAAVLDLPPGASVTHAYLYWGARRTVPGFDPDVTLDRPGGFTAAVTALAAVPLGGDPLFWYESVANVTALVQANGPGFYRVSGVDVMDVVNIDDSNVAAGWWMVVFYALASEPQRNLTLFDGLDSVGPADATVSVALSGFQVPNTPLDAKLAVVTLEGDNYFVGDGLSFDGSPLANAQNPVDNFFNGTRSFLGTPVSNVGDLPQLTGTAQSMAGLDLDVVDIEPYLTAGQNSAVIQATTVGDAFYLAGFVTSISSEAP